MHIALQSTRPVIDIGVLIVVRRSISQWYLYILETAGSVQNEQCIMV